MSILDSITTIGIVLGVIAIYGGLLLAESWLRHYQADNKETRLAHLVDILVMAAEQMNQRMGEGEVKLDWVMTQLKNHFADFDEDLARSLIEAAVHRMNKQTPPSTPSDFVPPQTALHRQWQSE